MALRIVLVALFAALLFAPAAVAGEGSVRLARGAESSFDVFTRSPGPSEQSFMRERYWRMRVYSPYFDSRLAWYRDGWVYQDAYAIYPDSSLVAAHPEWILRDGAGNRLWVQFACGGGSCTQYAADIGNPDFRAWWIAGAKAKLAAGYRGLFIDDVNMAQRVSDGNGVYTLPVDPRTGVLMNEAVWQRYMADFMLQVREALPGVEIVHNTIWTVGDATPDLRRQLNAADYIELERGFNDAGIVGGASKFGWQTLAAFIDRRHADGRAVILDGYAESAAGRLYGLATYFLLSSGRDALANDAATRPDAFWKGYDVGLGSALGARYRSGGVWRRDFTGGVVLVNEPGSPARTVEVGAGLRDVDGVARSSVTLGAASGAVLLSATGGPTAEAPASKPKRRTRASIRARARARGVRIRGRVSGATGGTVRIVVERRHSRRWATVRRARAAVRHDGAFRRRVARLSRGRYRTRAVYATAASGYRGFRIRGDRPGGRSPWGYVPGGHTPGAT